MSKTPGQIQAEIAALFPDNHVGAITPAALRTVTNDLTDMAVSVANVTGLAAVATSGAKADVGLGNVPNVDTSTQTNVSFTGLTAGAAVADADTFPTNQGAANLKQTFAAVKTWVKGWIVKADIGLGNADNTSDANKPVSTAQAAAIALKVPKVAMTDKAVVRANGAAGDVQDSLVLIDNIGTMRVPDDVTTNTGRVIVGTGGNLNSLNAAFLAQRSWTVTGTSLHTYADNTKVDAAGGLGFASFDSRVNFIGSQNYDHFNSFQSNVSYASTGTLLSFIGHTCTLSVSAGTITNVFGAILSNPAVSGTGVITNCYGLFVDVITAGSTFNRAIYTAGLAKSEFGGEIIATTGVTSPGLIQVNGFGGGLGYTAGAGAAVSQSTSKSTAVGINRPCGQITMNAAALAANTSVVFQMSNNTIAATDVVMVNVSGGIATTGTYMVCAEKAAAGSVQVHLRNVSGGSLSEAVVLQFAIIKAAIT